MRSLNKSVAEILEFLDDPLQGALATSQMAPQKVELLLRPRQFEVIFGEVRQPIPDLRKDRLTMNSNR